MLTLQLVPDQDNYAVTEGEDIIVTKVTGGLPRQRRDQLNAVVKVEIQWSLNPTDYQYLRAFYNYCNKGADQFFMQLILESPTLRTYVCNFVPGTWKLSAIKGTRYTVRTTLQVQPNEDGLDYAALVAAYEPEPYVPPPDPVDWGTE